MTATTAATLVLIATLAGGEGASWSIDAGLANGLRVGDSGRVYYELKVGDGLRRVDVGSARVVEVDDLSARLEIESERGARPGYRVGFELPGGRISPAEILRIAADRLEAGPFDELVARVVDDLVPIDPRIEERIARLIARLIAERRRQREAAAAALAATSRPPRPVVAVAAGTYRVGLPLTRARFFNQQPAHDVELAGFDIDLHPVGRRELASAGGPADGDPTDSGTPEPDPPATGVTFTAAREHCRGLGRRLPTEAEWEIARGETDLSSADELLEWTSSWYLPYPGNDRPEPEYGERFKVLKGAASRQDPDRFLRRFLDPAQAHERVGFRCVSATAATETPGD